MLGEDVPEDAHCWVEEVGEHNRQGQGQDEHGQAPEASRKGGVIGKVDELGNETKGQRKIDGPAEDAMQPRDHVAGPAKVLVCHTARHAQDAEAAQVVEDHGEADEGLADLFGEGGRGGRGRQLPADQHQEQGDRGRDQGGQGDGLQGVPECVGSDLPQGLGGGADGPAQGRGAA